MAKGITSLPSPLYGALFPDSQRDLGVPRQSLILSRRVSEDRPLAWVRGARIGVISYGRYSLWQHDLL